MLVEEGVDSYYGKLDGSYRPRNKKETQKTNAKPKPNDLYPVHNQIGLHCLFIHKQYNFHI